MNMNRCIRVCEADAITNHTHSILIAFKNNQNEEKMIDDKLEKIQTNEHPIICYVKADTTEEIRWWQNSLQVYAKQNAICLQPSSIHFSFSNNGLNAIKSLDDETNNFYEEILSKNLSSNSQKLDLIQVCVIIFIINFKDLLFLIF